MSRKTTIGTDAADGLVTLTMVEAGGYWRHAGVIVTMDVGTWSESVGPVDPARLRAALDEIDPQPEAAAEPLSRGFTVEDDAMLARAVAEWERVVDSKVMLTGALRMALRAALTPPPARPEGAEEIEAILRDLDGAGFMTDPVLLSRHLAEHGVRVTGGAA